MPITCYLLSPRGFCSGVTRAVSMANQVLKLYGTVYITEDIIHNKVFMKQLEEQGMIKVDSIDDIPDGSVVMFSAHGVSPQVIDKAEKKELTIIDATCPIVKTIQNQAKAAADSSKKIIIIGNRSHAEIIALMGYANNTGVYVVSNEMDVDILPDFSNDEVIYFTQTTLDYSMIESVIKKLKKKIPGIQSTDESNICYATKERQEVVRRIASSVDLVIVVGSSHSSNAKRLAEAAADAGAKRSILIDSKEDLQDYDFNGIKSIAITSAASTPEEIVQDLICYLREKFDIVVEEFNIQNAKSEG